MSETSESNTPLRASSVARYWAFAASFKLRMRPHKSISQPKLTLTLWRSLVASVKGGTNVDCWPRDHCPP